MLRFSVLVSAIIYLLTDTILFFEIGNVLPSPDHCAQKFVIIGTVLDLIGVLVDDVDDALDVVVADLVGQNLITTKAAPIVLLSFGVIMLARAPTATHVGFAGIRAHNIYNVNHGVSPLVDEVVIARTKINVNIEF
jgi:hypothetical protein